MRTRGQALDGGIRRTGNQQLSAKRIDAWVSRKRSGQLKADDPKVKLTDGDGMYLFVTAAGTATWRLKYYFDGQELTYTIGPYPGVSLEAARAKREWARGVLREGRNPSQVKALERAASVVSSGNTFEPIMDMWLKKNKKDWRASHYDKVALALKRDVAPLIGHLPIAEITPPMIVKVVERVADRGAIETASRIRQYVRAIFRLAQAKGLTDYKENPAEAAIEILPKAKKVVRRPALLKFTELGAVLREARKADLTPAVHMAHRLLAFSMCRIGNVVSANWREFDLDANPPVWVVPRDQMKKHDDREHNHKIILGPTIVAELRDYRKAFGGRGLLFGSNAGAGHVTRESIEKVYRETLGLRGRHVPHGWRAAFSTLSKDKDDVCDERGNLIDPAFDKDAIDLTLDHIHDSAVARAYDRGERLKRRIRLMLWWDENLTAAERGADVLRLRTLTA